MTMATLARAYTVQPAKEGYLKPVADGHAITMQEAQEFLAMNGVVLPETFEPILALQIKCMEVALSSTASYPYILSYGLMEFEYAKARFEELGVQEKQFLEPVRDFYNHFFGGESAEKVTNGEATRIRPVQGVTAQTYFSMPIVLGMEEGVVKYYRLQAK